MKIAQNSAEAWAPVFTGPLRGRRTQIDSLRAVAIFLVLKDHYAPWGPRLGELGVQLFLLISGYLITRILLQTRDRAGLAGAPVWGGLKAYYIKRALRIWPVYFLTVSSVWLTHPEGIRQFIGWYLTFTPNILFAIRNEWGPPWYLGHLWTLGVQEQFYLAWPFLVLFLPQHWLPKVVAVSIGAGLLFRALMFLFGWDQLLAAWVLPFACLGALGLGGGIALLELSPAGLGWFRPRPVLVLGALAVIVGLQAALPQRWSYLTFGLFSVGPLGLLLMGAVHGYAGRMGSVLDARWIQYLGRISLGIYVFHLPVSRSLSWLVWRFAGDDRFNGPSNLLFLVATPLTVGVAALSWRFLEGPINRLRTQSLDLRVYRSAGAA